MTTQDQSLNRLAYTVKEACAISTFGRTRLYQLLAENRIESRLVGRRRLIVAASLHKLTETRLRALKTKDMPCKVAGQRGLYVEVTPAGSKLWRFRYRIGGVQKKLLIGS